MYLEEQEVARFPFRLEKKCVKAVNEQVLKEVLFHLSVATSDRKPF